MMANSFHVVLAAAVLGGSLLSGELHVVLFLEIFLKAPAIDQDFFAYLCRTYVSSTYKLPDGYSGEPRKLCTSSIADPLSFDVLHCAYTFLVAALRTELLLDVGYGSHLLKGKV